MKTYDEIRSKFHALNLMNLSASLQGIVEKAETNQISYLQLIEILADCEINARNGKRKNLYLKKAHFPAIKTLEEFDFSHQKTINKKQIQSLLDFVWIDNHENLVFYGPSGIGKTHLSIAIGIRAINAGYKIMFCSSQALIEQLAMASFQNKLKDKMREFLKYDVVIVDELGYLPWNKQSVHLYFQLINKLYEQRSLIITSNKAFSEWGEFFLDETSATAIVYRIIHHCYIFPMGGESYRLKFQKSKKEENNLLLTTA